MKTYNFTISINSREHLDIVDITDQIIQEISKSNIQNGLVNIQTLHTTATIILNENEPLLINDLKKSLEDIASQNASYQHDDFTKRTINMCDNECKNGNSHCKAMYLPSNICLNLIDTKLQLGIWQRIMFVELDSARPRKIQIQIIGQ